MDIPQDQAIPQDDPQNVPGEPVDAEEIQDENEDHFMPEDDNDNEIADNDNDEDAGGNDVPEVANADEDDNWNDADDGQPQD